MPSWNLIVVADQEYKLPVGKEKATAQAALVEAREFIGMNGVVTIADQLSLEAKTIKSVRIVQKPDSGVFVA